MRKKIGLAYGGLSKERQVSKLSAKNVLRHLDKKKYSVVDIEIKHGKLPIDQLKRVDVVLIMVHGPGGEDGTLQGVLEILGKPYTGSGVLASALAMNKILVKQIVSRAGIRVPKSFEKTDLIKTSQTVVVKPASIGSSLGISVVPKKDLNSAIKKASALDKQIVIEEYVRGREFTVPVIGNNKPRAFPVIEIKPKFGKFFDYDSKYKTGGSEEIVPAKISRKLARELQRQAILVHKLLGCRGITRSDFIVDPKGRIYFLEINTIPGMTENSLVPKSAKAAGISLPKLMDEIIRLAEEE